MREKRLAQLEGKTLDFVKPIAASFQRGGQTTIDISPAGKGMRIPQIAELLAHEEAPEKVALGFIGDEISSADILSESGIILPSDGNDFSVAKAENMINKEVGFHFPLIVHVGPTGLDSEGKKIRVMSNTTTLYGSKQLNPVNVDVILASVAASFQKGEEAINLIKDSALKERILEALHVKKLSLGSFGIESSDQGWAGLSESQARELLSVVGIGADAALVSSRKTREGGINLDPAMLNLQVRGETGRLSDKSLMGVNQMKLKGVYPVILDLRSLTTLSTYFKVDINYNKPRTALPGELALH